MILDILSCGGKFKLEKNYYYCYHNYYYYYYYYYY